MTPFYYFSGVQGVEPETSDVWLSTFTLSVTESLCLILLSKDFRVLFVRRVFLFVFGCSDEIHSDDGVFELTAAPFMFY